MSPLLPRAGSTLEGRISEMSTLAPEEVVTMASGKASRGCARDLWRRKTEECQRHFLLKSGLTESQFRYLHIFLLPPVYSGPLQPIRYSAALCEGPGHTGGSGGEGGGGCLLDGGGEGELHHKEV